MAEVGNGEDRLHRVDGGPPWHHIGIGPSVQDDDALLDLQLGEPAAPPREGAPLTSHRASTTDTSSSLRMDIPSVAPSSWRATVPAPTPATAVPRAARTAERLEMGMGASLPGASANVKHVLALGGATVLPEASACGKKLAMERNRDGGDPLPDGTRVPQWREGRGFPGSVPGTGTLLRRP